MPKKIFRILITSRNERALVKNQAMFNILNSLKKKVDISETWILYPSGKDHNKERPKLDQNFKLFEDFNTDDVLKILDIEKPDLLISSNDYEFFGRSFVLGAKKKKIPSVLVLQRIFSDAYMNKKNTSLIKGRFSIINQRGFFILKKYKILLKTYHNTGINFGKILFYIFKDLIDPFLDSEPAGKFGCDLILTNDKNTEIILKKRKIYTKIIVTGDPGLDSTYQKILNCQVVHNIKSSEINVVLVTTGYVEHGIWTKNMWTTAINHVLNAVKKNQSERIKFSIKIHPVTERKNDYQKLINNQKLNIPIYQTEDLFGIISNADVIISLGTGSWAIVEAVLMKKRILVVNLFNEPIENLPYVKFNVASQVKNLDDFSKKISEIYDAKISEDRINNFIEKYLYKFDGKSSERSATEILELISKK
jgi:hypothetical protein